jgi:3D (Asp-Asp-Asp) domain-containing protein
MDHKRKRHHKFTRLKKKLKHVAAAVAGAVILTGAMLPGVPTATVHAAASNPNKENNPVTATQELSKADMAENSAVNLKAGTATVNPEQAKDAKPTATHEKQKDDTHAATNSESSDKAPTNYKEVLNISATAYAPGAHDNDQWGNKTYTGEQIKPGVIAVDPSIIPLGSRVYIQYPDGHGEYATASDTGGAIKGNKIDVAKRTVSEAQDFGIQHVKVFVVHSPEKDA